MQHEMLERHPGGDYERYCDSVFERDFHKRYTRVARAVRRDRVARWQRAYTKV